MAKKRNLEIVEYHKFIKPELLKDAQSLFNDMKEANKKPVLSATFDATHSGRLTNGRVYPGSRMKRGVDSFVKPSPKAVLKHHDDASDPVGRIESAKYIQLKYGPEFDNDFKNPQEDAGSGFIQLSVNIMDADTIEKIIDGRLCDISTSQSCHGMFCSICGDNIHSTKSECEHWPGKYYTAEDSENEYLCYMITGDLTYREASLVAVPADSYAKVSSLKLKHSEDSFLIKSYDSLGSNIGSLVLSDASSNKKIQLIKGNKKEQVTVADKEELTGKILVAVSPNFNDKQYEASNKETSMTKTTEQKNTATGAASADGGTPTQAGKTNDSKEGVVAPENSGNATQTVGTATLSDKAGQLAIEAMAKSLEDATHQAKEAKDELERLRGTLKDKDAEIEKLRVNGATMLADMKQSYANMLLNTQLLLKKPVVSTVKDQTAFDAKLKEYSERSVDSLKDSLKDLTPELSALKDTLGVRSITDLVSDKKLDNVVANVATEVSDKKIEVVSKRDALETFLNN